MASQGEIELTIVNRQNALTVVDVVLELPGLYTLNEIAEFLQEHKLLALFREELVFETEQGVKLDGKSTIGNVAGQHQNQLRLFATRNSPSLSPSTNQQITLSKSLSSLMTEPKVLKMIAPIIPKPRKGISLENISCLSESLVDQKIQLEVKVHDLTSRPFSSIDDVMPRIMVAINSHNRNQNWTRDTPYRITYSNKRPLHDLSIRMNQIPDLIQDKVARFSIEMAYLGGGGC